MLLILYGTKEARELMHLLLSNNYQVYGAAATEYGLELAKQDGALDVFFVVPKRNDLKKLLIDKRVQVVIDASQPFSSELSGITSQVCQQNKICYIRLQRKETKLPEHPLIYPVSSWTEAAIKASELGKTVFLTTGSNNLETFVNSKVMQGKRIVVRVLPEHRVVKKCQDLGLKPKDIVALHGPFSTKFNRSIFKAYRADVIVTKDSGPSSGTNNKILAALDLKIPVVVIKRDVTGDKNVVYNYKEILNLLRQTYAKN
ncbi:precorrin-6A reductase [Desulfolucanica intricata]|uniref:precorrin-6A reductase n=1 Tax=Desulfolucanica intricata TaxID=1285191 RepID=UPI0009EDE964|nr:precorrin-6A reductase [Desulfolucanica intricata]